MKNLTALLLDKLVPQWVSASFPIIRAVLIGIIGLCSVSLIITILMQSNSNANGIDAINGQESYYANNKGRTRDGRLKIWTIVAASIIAFCIILFFVTMLVYNPTV